MDDDLGPDATSLERLADEKGLQRPAAHLAPERVVEEICEIEAGQHIATHRTGGACQRPRANRECVADAYALLQQEHRIAGLLRVLQDVIEGVDPRERASEIADRPAARPEHGGQLAVEGLALEGPARLERVRPGPG